MEKMSKIYFQRILALLFLAAGIYYMIKDGYFALMALLIITGVMILLSFLVGDILKRRNNHKQD